MGIAIFPDVSQLNNRNYGKLIKHMKGHEQMGNFTTIIFGGIETLRWDILS